MVCRSATFDVHCTCSSLMFHNFIIGSSRFCLWDSMMMMESQKHNTNDLVLGFVFNVSTPPERHMATSNEAIFPQVVLPSL